MASLPTKIVYLKPVHLVELDNKRNPQVVLVEEDVSAVLTLRRCAASLELFHDFIPTPEQTERCYWVFWTLLERTGNLDGDVFYSPYYVKHGVFPSPDRKEFAKQMLERKLTVCSHWNSEFDGGGDPVTLGQIVRDDTHYATFRAFWDLIPTVQQYRDALCVRFPKDIANKIVSTVTNTPYFCEWRLADGTKLVRNGVFGKMRVSSLPIFDD